MPKSSAVSGFSHTKERRVLSVLGGWLDRLERWRHHAATLVCRRGVCLAAVLLLAAVGVLPAQAQYEPDDEPLLPDMVGTYDVEMRARYVRQWTEEDGTHVLVFSGGFDLDYGRRHLSANNAVVWVTAGQSAEEGRRYFDLDVYLSEDAQVVEPAGTVIEDTELLVTNIRTYGRVVKEHDAHAPEAMRDSSLYQRAWAARLGREAGAPLAPTEVEPVDVMRPGRDEPRKPAPVIRYDLANVDAVQTPDGETVQIATGGVYFSRSGGPGLPMLEIRAANAVVFLSEGMLSMLERRLGGDSSADEGSTEQPTPSEPPAEGTPPESSTPETPPAEAPTDVLALGEQSGIAGTLEAVYLEGDVVLSLGDRFIRANRLYYDFANDKALILDAVLRAEVPERGVPLYIRADEIRQLSAREFSATNPKLSTSEFYTPHYHVGAERVVLVDKTERTSTGRPAGEITGQYTMYNATTNIGGLPVSWWPYAKGKLETSETLLRRFSMSYSDDRGPTVETAWYMFNLLGVQAPPGYDATLKLDYFGERGPGLGIDADYQREDYFGLFRSYYMHDDGEDNLGPLRDNVPTTKERGRVLWRHRHYLPNDWEATLEVAYISDPSYLEEYEKSEWFEGKEQETALYLKRARGTEAISLLANWRLLDFTTQTEHLPDLTYRRIGDTWLDPILLYHESRAGVVRYQLDDRHWFDRRWFNNDGDSDSTFRADLRQEAELPIKIPGFNVVPFATGRASYWDGQPLDDGALWRGLGIYGIRGGGYLSRVYDSISSELLDIDRIRHIIHPHFVAWWAHSNTRSEWITPFDEGIETIDDFYGTAFGVRQIWQTKRGGEGHERTVDLLTFNLEAGFFGDGQEEYSNGYANPIRPEDSRTRNYIAGDAVYRLSDTTSLLYDFNIDVNDWKLDRHNVSLAVERLPRLAYVLGYRHAGDLDLDLVGGGWNYRLNEKHITAVRVWLDVDRGDVGEIAISYIRKLPRWYFAVNFEMDEVFDDMKVTVSLWPEGIPEWTLGSRRFTGLSTTTGIKP